MPTPARIAAERPRAATLPMPLRRFRLLPWCLPATAWAATLGDSMGGVGEGLADGVQRVAAALGHWLWHPLVTVDGIVLALSDRRQGVEVWQRAGGELLSGLSADPAGTAASLASLLVCAAGCVAVAVGLSEAGRRGWRAMAEALPRPRAAGRIGRLRRARAMRRERRRGEGAGHGSWARRLRHAGEDLRDGLLTVWRHGGAGVGFLALRAGGALGRSGAGLMRQSGQLVAYLALPLALLADPWIDLSVQRAATARAAEAQLVPAARAFLAAAPGLSVSALDAQAAALRRHYAAHRQQLLAPIRRLDAALDGDLARLEAQLGEGGLSDATIDHRLDHALMGFAGMRLRWLAVLVLPLPAGAADPLAVPRTWFENRATEAAVFAAARARVTDPAHAAVIDAILARLAAERDYEQCLRTWDASVLLAQPLPEVDACGGRP
ncbi:hypothetical protein [Denitromonas iodatirespirans]|uniref:Uncharacterized protein n=1 Tax=Denitromonas iodatirespirans TaxID=2795389 RepID=A0A944DES4_DENI1|nr:hypothetical protein [Denitromonas iodatirespirans]MBT0963741.1 hypothetical protein [Denitromonas iodatirespirans]